VLLLAAASLVANAQPKGAVMLDKLIPVPQKTELRPGTFAIAGDLWLHTAQSTDERHAHLCELLKPLAQPAADIALGPHTAVLGRSAEAPAPSPVTAPARPEAYALAVESERIWIEGSDLAGLHYGVRTLRQLLDLAKPAIPCMLIEDWPDIAFRGFGAYVGLNEYDRPHTVENYRKLIALAAEHKFNHFSFADESVWTRALPNTIVDRDLEELARLCRLNFLEPIPMPLFLYMGRKQVAKYVEASDEEFAKLMSPVNRLIRTMRPKVINIGADELVSAYDYTKRSSIYLTAQRQKRAPHEWLLLCLKRFHGYLAARDVQMAMWADPLVDGTALWGHPCLLQDYGGPPDCHYRMVDRLPKDIVVWDWHYDPSHVYPTMDYLQAKGFPTVGCPWHTPWNPEMYCEYARRRATDRFVGMMPLDWQAGWPWPRLRALVARQGDCVWSVGKYASAPSGLEKYRQVLKANPLLNIPRGEHQITVKAEPATRGLSLLAHSSGVRGARALTGGIGAKKGRTIEVRYRVSATRGCAFARCRVSLALTEAFSGMVDLATGRDDELVQFGKIGAASVPLDLTARVAGRPEFCLRLRGTNTSDRTAVLLKGMEVECRIAAKP